MAAWECHAGPLRLVDGPIIISQAVCNMGPRKWHLVIKHMSYHAHSVLG